MARKRKDDGAAGCLLALLGIAAAAVFFGLVILVPIALVVWWLFSECRRVYRSGVDPNPTEEEAAESAACDALISQLSESRTQIEEMGALNSIPKRADDMFDERYGLARELNSQLASIGWQFDEATSRAHAVQSMIDDRIDLKRSVVAHAAASRLGLAVYGGVFILCVTTHPEWISSLGGIVNRFGVPATAEHQVWIGSSASASLCAIAAAWSRYKTS
jgi:hypothetical protein